MKQDCIINVACGSWYPRGQDRLVRTAKENGYSGEFMTWRDSFPPGCPGHSKAPYAFKPYAFEAARREGFQRVLWMDAAIVVENSLDPIFDEIEKNNCFLMDNVGWNSGEWCTDGALEGLGLTREDSFNWPQLMACVMGLNFDSEIANKFLDQWLALANDGKTFVGKHTNVNGECSQDKRVRGHRHDQTAASIVSIRLKMPWQHPFRWIHYPCWDHKKESHVIMESRGGEANL